MTIALIKKQIRQEVLAKRSAICPQDADFMARTVASKAIQMFQTNSICAVYFPIKDELDTSPLIHSLWDLGASVCLPQVVALDAPLIFRTYHPKTVLIQGKYGIFHPSQESSVVIPSILFIPLLVFDRDLNRLGYGGGFYDRTIKQLRQQLKPLCVGLGFSCQEAKAVPKEKTDQKMDLVITEKEFIKGD